MGSVQIKELLNNEIFYLYILLFSESVNIINKFNIRLQNQELCIAGLKSNIDECYNAILDIVLKADLWDQDRSLFLRLDFQDTEIQSIYFMEPKEFLRSISGELSSKFAILLYNLSLFQVFMIILQDFLIPSINIFLWEMIKCNYLILLN